MGTALRVQTLQRLSASCVPCQSESGAAQRKVRGITVWCLCVSVGGGQKNTSSNQQSGVYFGGRFSISLAKYLKSSTSIHPNSPGFPGSGCSGSRISVIFPKSFSQQATLSSLGNPRTPRSQSRTPCQVLVSLPGLGPDRRVSRRHARTFGSFVCQQAAALLRSSSATS